MANPDHLYKMPRMHRAFAISSLLLALSFLWLLGSDYFREWRKYQAEFTKYITYGPTNKKAYDLGTIDAAYAKRLTSSPENTAKQLPINLDWYIKNEEKASALYQNMLTE